MRNSIKYFGELYLALVIIVVIMAVGCAGFIILEDYTFTDALYMTVITVTTVGFGEIKELSSTGRFFTIGLILTSFITFAYAISALSSHIFNGDYARYYKKYKMDQQITKLNKHIVICGSGDIGREALENILKFDKHIVVVEQNAEKISSLREAQIPHVEGDATDEDTLKLAGIEKASALITTLPKDADNVFVVLTARQLNSSLEIVSTCAADSSRSKLLSAGCNNIVMPDKVGGLRMAGFIIHRNISRFLDKIAIVDTQGEHIREVVGSELVEELRSGSVAEIIAYYHTDCKVIGIKQGSGGFLVNPANDVTITPACELYFLGTTVQIRELSAALKANA